MVKKVVKKKVSMKKSYSKKAPQKASKVNSKKVVLKAPSKIESLNAIKSPLKRIRVAWNSFVFFALLFLIIIVSFHHAIEITRPPRQKRVNNMMKNYNAAVYAQKLEEKVLIKEEREKKLREKYKTIKPDNETYPKDWEKLFNEDN